MQFTSTPKGFEAMLQQCDQAVGRFDRMLEGFMYGQRVDEIALITSGTMHLHHTWAALQDLGWVNFNNAKDSVKTGPIRSAYDVDYHFFSHPEFSWRLELMQLLEGVSPLHEALTFPGFDHVMPVHASFKVADEDTYVVARSVLGEMGYEEAQRCDSTYGRFSYWTPLNPAPDGPTAAVPYLKPRVNMRDQAVI